MAEEGLSISTVVTLHTSVEQHSWEINPLIQIAARK